MRLASRRLTRTHLTIQLKEAAPYFLNVAALWVGAPVREDLVEAGGETWWSDPANYIGNGPFQITEWEHQSRVRFERNENYVLTKPTFEAIEGSMITEGNVAFEAYRADELDIGGVGSEELATVEGDDRAEVGVLAVGWLVYLLPRLQQRYRTVRQQGSASGVCPGHRPRRLHA